MIESDIPLSPQGERRREAILQQALLAARSRKRRRLGTRGLVLLFAGAGAVMLLRNEAKKPSSVQLTVNSAPTVAAEPAVQIEWLNSDPSILDRLALHPSPPQWTSIGDDELLDAMAAAGQPSGMIRVGDETILMPHLSTTEKGPGT